MENPMSLVLAKFPPHRVPALVQEMKKELGVITSTTGAAPLSRDAYQQAILHGEGIEAALASGGGLDIVLVDQDLDEVGYGLHGSLQGKLRSFSARQIKLEPEEAQQREDAEVALATLYPQGTEIFRYNFAAEWNAVKLLLERSRRDGMPLRLQRLGAAVELQRLERCHTILGQLLGYTAGLPGSPEEKVVALFEKAIQRLIAGVVVEYPEDTDADRRWRAILLGPYERHLNTYLQDRRRQREARAVEADTTAPIPDNATD
jgi:hypothetical protein